LLSLALVNPAIKSWRLESDELSYLLSKLLASSDKRSDGSSTFVVSSSTVEGAVAVASAFTSLVEFSVILVYC